MATVAELQGRLEANTLTINSLTAQLKEIKTDLDFPHTCRKMLETANAAINRMRDELQKAEASRMVLLNRLDTDALTLRYQDLCDQKDSLLGAREAINQELTLAREHAGNVKEVKSELNTLRKLTEGMTQEQVLEMVRNMFAGGEVATDVRPA